MLIGVPRRRGRGDDGAAVVEFAIVMPVLLLVVFGIVNFGVLFATQISLNTAARDAARAGVVGTSTSAKLCREVALQARNSADPVGGNASSIQVTVTSPTVSCAMAAGTTTVTGSPNSKACTASGSNGTLVVRVSYPFAALVPLVPPQSSTLTSSASFRCEYT